MELILIRHARPGRDENSADPPLTDLGLEQAARVGERLKIEPISHIVSSSMQRAAQTAAPLAEALGLQVELRDDLRELDEHRGEYIPAEEMKMTDEFMDAFKEDPLLVFGGKEQHETMKVMITAAIDEIVAQHRGGTVAVFCHGGVIGTYLQVLLNQEVPFFIQMDYTGIARLTCSSKGMRTIRSINETGHVFELLKRWGSEA